MSAGAGVTLEREQPGPRDDRPGLLLKTPYNAEMIEDLKAQLPIPDRAWSAELEGWWVAAEHEDYVTQLAVKHFGGIMVIGGAEGDVLVDAAGRTRQERLL